MPAGGHTLVVWQPAVCVSLDCGQPLHPVFCLLSPRLWLDRSNLQRECERQLPTADATSCARFDELDQTRHADGVAKRVPYSCSEIAFRNLIRFPINAFGSLRLIG